MPLCKWNYFFQDVLDLLEKCSINKIFRAKCKPRSVQLMRWILCIFWFISPEAIDALKILRQMTPEEKEITLLRSQNVLTGKKKLDDCRWHVGAQLFPRL